MMDDTLNGAFVLHKPHRATPRKLTSIGMWGVLMEESGANKTKIYSPIQVAVSSFFGGPCAAVFVLWKNFQGLRSTTGATQTAIWGTVLTLLIFLVTPFLPEKFPNSAIPAAYTVVAFSIARQRQLSKKAILESEQYEIRSNWDVLGISVGFLLATVVIVIAWIFLLDYLGIIDLV